MNRYENRMRELQPSFRPHPGADIIPLFSEERKRPSLDERQLAHVEQAIGKSLPNDYREFLTDFGATFVYRMLFSFQEQGRPSKDYIEQFYGIAPDVPLDDLASEYDDYQGRIPVDLLPIGEDAVGNIICLGLTGEKRGKVYFWDHEREEMEPDDAPPNWQPGYSNISFVADSFDEFFFSLQPQE